MGDNVNEADKQVELFSVLELVLSEKKVDGYGYKDVFYLKNRKKNPYQANIWWPEHKDQHINLGVFVRHKRQPSHGPTHQGVFGTRGSHRVVLYKHCLPDFAR